MATSKRMSPNQREALSAISTVTSKQEYLTSTAGALNVNASVSISGSAIPITGATTALVVGIVDGSGNQITSFGGGTQYTDGGTPPTHPIGPTIIYDNGGTWQHVSAANPLPVTGGGGGTQYTNGAAQASPVGNVALGYDGTNVRALLTTATGAQVLGAGSAVIGHVIADSGSTTVVSSITAALPAGTNLLGKVGIDQTTPGTTNNVMLTGAGSGGVTIKDDTTVGDALTTGILSVAARLWNGTSYDRSRGDTTSGLWVNVKATASPVIAAGAALIGKVGIDQTTPGTTNLVALAANQSVNNAQINGVTPLMGNGVTGTGSQRVTIASDNTAFSVNATLSAETTKVIGVTRTADGSGNLLTSTGNALDVNLKSGSIANTGFVATQTDTFGAATALTITLASLANSTAGVGRQSTLVTSNTARSALIACKITMGTSPTANTLIYVYLIRGDGTLNDDNAGATDAGLTVINAPLLGTILCSAVTSNVSYYGLFDTKFLGSLGPTFGIAVVNSSGAALNATGGNFTCEYTKIT